MAELFKNVPEALSDLMLGWYHRRFQECLSKAYIFNFLKKIVEQQRIPRNLFYLPPSEKPELIKLGHALFLFQSSSQSQFS